VSAIERSLDVLIVGAGPAGLATALELANSGFEVEVLEREQVAGGIARHSNHGGYGARDLHRFMSGPAYARHYVDAVIRSGVRLRTGASATGWVEPHTLSVTSRAGPETIRARAVVLATGARERPRSARLVAGTRPSGVFTTGQLQQLVHLEHRRLEGRAVIVGAEHVSYSAAMTLHHAGARVVAMLTDQPRHQSYAAFDLAARRRYRFELLTSSSVTRLVGRDRLEGVEVRGAHGDIDLIGADLVVFTGDWIADHELARLGGLVIDVATTGPRVDTSLATSAEGVFAAGNLVHPVETADVVALDGRHVARSVTSYLRSSVDAIDVIDAPARIDLVTQAPLRWVAPQQVLPGVTPPRGRFILYTSRFARRPTIAVRQGPLLVHHQRVGHAIGPNRPFSIDASWTTRIIDHVTPLEVCLE
jgi:thioredoxin reductase